MLVLLFSFRFYTFRLYNQFQSLDIVFCQLDVPSITCCSEQLARSNIIIKYKHQFSSFITLCLVLTQHRISFIDYLPIQFMLATYITFIPWNMFVNMNMATAFKCWHPCRIIWIYAIPTSSTTTTFL